MNAFYVAVVILDFMDSLSLVSPVDISFTLC